MTLRSVLVAASLITVGLAAAPAAGTHASTDCSPTETEPTVQAQGLAVFVDEVAGNNTAFSAWVYMEANGLDGIQRQDSYTEDLGTSDVHCGHGPDAIII